MTLRRTSYRTNNSVVLLDDIGDTSGALHCITDLDGCCVDPDQGEWYYPNGTEVSTGYGFHTTRSIRTMEQGGGGRVSLRRKAEVVSPTGTYCCQVLTATNGSNNDTFCVFLSEFKTYIAIVTQSAASNVSLCRSCGDHC